MQLSDMCLSLNSGCPAIQLATRPYPNHLLASHQQNLKELAILVVQHATCAEISNHILHTAPLYLKHDYNVDHLVRGRLLPHASRMGSAMATQGYARICATKGRIPTVHIRNKIACAIYSNGKIQTEPPQSLKKKLVWDT